MPNLGSRRSSRLFLCRPSRGRPSWPLSKGCQGLSEEEQGVEHSLPDSVVPTAAAAGLLTSASGICAVVSKSQLLQTSTSMCLLGPGLFSLTQGEQRLLPGKQNPCQPTKDQTTCKRQGHPCQGPGIPEFWMALIAGPPPSTARPCSRAVCATHLGKEAQARACFLTC